MSLTSEQRFPNNLPHHWKSYLSQESEKDYFKNLSSFLRTEHRAKQTVFPAPAEEIHAELLRSGRWDGEVEKVQADGKKVVVASRWSLRRDERGRPAAILETKPALAVPAFAVQTSQPCATCHIGAFGPQLTPQGRDFKLNGYVNNDGQDHGLPLTFATQTSFTHTAVPRPGGAAPGFKPNDNISRAFMAYALDGFRQHFVAGT